MTPEVELGSLVFGFLVMIILVITSIVAPKDGGEEDIRWDEIDQ